MKSFEEMRAEEKEKIFKKYYSWVLDIPEDEVILEREFDATLARTYVDPYIYYPKIMGDIYKTDALQKMERISQLGLVVIDIPTAYQNRLEHCKGTAYRKLEENVMLITQNETYRKILERNNFKLYLLAEEIKGQTHDIGHQPLSHIIEIRVVGRREFHEEIGKRILLEDKQIQEIIMQIPGLKQAVQEVVEKDILNNEEHDEGNIDVDRMDYRRRDDLYMGMPKDYEYPMYERIMIEQDKEGNIRKKCRWKRKNGR